MATPTTPIQLPDWRTTASQYTALARPRVTQLAVFCAVIGMFLATSGMVPWLMLIGSTVGIWLFAGVAFAISCLVERRIDAMMCRTTWRPSASGELGVRQILVFSLMLDDAGMWTLHIFVNNLTMWLTFATSIGYAIIYILPLKPTTPQDIVIGGLSGATSPTPGQAAVANSVPAEAWILALIIFTWTPPRFWTPALYRRADYAKSGLPILPITHGEKYTLLYTLLYTLIMIAATILPLVYGMSDYIYLVTTLVFGPSLLSYVWHIYRRCSDALAQKTFRYPIIYPSVLFTALLVDRYFKFGPALTQSAAL